MIVSENFFPTDSSGGRLLTELAEDLVAHGSDVTVLTSAVRTAVPPAKRWKDCHRGVRIRRLPRFGFSRKSIWSRLVSELSLTASIFLALVLQPRPDRLLVTSSPPFLAPAAALVAALRRVPLVFVVMDLFPEIAAATGNIGSRSLTYRFWDALSRFALRRADDIIVLGRCMEEVVRKKLNGRAHSLHVIPTWADGNRIRPIVKSRDNPFLNRHPELLDTFVVQYSGNLGRFHDFETLLDAAERLRDRSDIRFVICGDGARRSWLQSELERRRLHNVELLPFQPEEDLPYLLAAQNVSLVTLAPGTEGLCVPSKVYPILAAGRPVVAVMASWAEVARLVDEEELGYVVRQGDVDGLVAALEEMSSSPDLCRALGDRARRLQQSRFDRTHAVARYLAVLASKRGQAGPVAAERSVAPG